MSITSSGDLGPGILAMADRSGPRGAGAHGTTAGPALEPLFREQFDRLVRLAGYLGADDPEDVVQESFFKLARARDVRGDGAVPYLNRIVVNTVRDRARQRRRARRLRLVDDAVADSAETIAGRRDEHRRVITALQQIGTRQREALVLRFWADLTYEQIADAMGVRIGTAKSLVSRGLTALDDRMDRG